MLGILRRSISAFHAENASTEPKGRLGRSAALSAFVSSATALAFVWLAYSFGIAHRFHQVMPDAIESHNVSLATAITEYFHGIHGGYVAHAKVLAALREHGMSYFPSFLEPLGKKHPDVLWEPETMNDAIRSAVEVRDLSPMSLGDGSMVPMIAEDLGLSDFYKISFSLFGPLIKGFFDTYYVLFLVSLIAFGITYFRYPVAMAAAVLLCATHYLLMNYVVLFGVSLQELSQLATVHNRRFISALGVLPAFYLLLWVLLRPRLSGIRIAASIAQVVLLLFVMTMRASIVYAVAALGFLFAALLIRRMKQASSGCGFVAARLFLRLPALLIIVGFAALSIYRASSVNRLYYDLEEYIPHHLVWHSAYYGLAYHPEWQERFGAAHGDASGDDVPIRGAALYLSKNFGLDGSYLIVGPGRGTKWRIHERILRGAYFEFIRDNPLFMLELDAWFKPIIFLDLYAQTMLRIFVFLPAWKIALGLLVMIGVFGLSIRGARDWLKGTIATGVALGCATLASIAPVIFAYPAYHAMGDQIWWINMFIGFVALSLIAHTGCKVLRARQVGR